MGLLNRIFGDGETPEPAGAASPAVETAPAGQGETATAAPGGGDKPDDGGIDALVSQVAAEHGSGTPGGAGPEPAKRGRGRPPTHGKYSKANGSDGKRPVEVAGEGPVEPDQVADDPAESFALPADLLAEFVNEALTVVDDHLAGRLQSLAAKNKIPEDEAEPVIESAKLGSTRRSLIAKAVPYALQEHGISAGVSPTACIGTLVLVWGLGHLRAASALGPKPIDIDATATPK